MPIITFANPKGGAGKTTAALLLASELAAHRAEVVIIDADPERWISQWAGLPGKPDTIRVVSDVTEDSIVDQIDEAARATQFVIIDLEGTASLMAANAVGMSDFVVIPTQGGSMDARGAAKMIRLIHNQERMARREIPHAVLLTRISAAVASRSLKNVRGQLDAAGIPVVPSKVFVVMHDQATVFAFTDIDLEHPISPPYTLLNGRETVFDAVVVDHATAMRDDSHSGWARRCRLLRRRDAREKDEAEKRQ